jgi:small subunit ribosomal protein S17
MEETEAVTTEEADAAAAGEPAVEASAETEDKPADAEAASADEPSVFEEVIETVSAAAGTVASTVSETVSNVVSAVTGSANDNDGKKVSKRAEKIGVVQSDQNDETVVVRVDRLVKHPIYRKYVKRRKKFMAHDELGAGIGDKVRIIETRPLSARKRWRVVEIIQKALK